MRAFFFNLQVFCSRHSVLMKSFAKQRYISILLSFAFDKDNGSRDFAAAFPRGPWWITKLRRWSFNLHVVHWHEKWRWDTSTKYKREKRGQQQKRQQSPHFLAQQYSALALFVFTHLNRDKKVAIYTLKHRHGRQTATLLTTSNNFCKFILLAAHILCFQAAKQLQLPFFDLHCFWRKEEFTQEL